MIVIHPINPGSLAVIDAISVLCNDAIDRKVFPGCVVGVVTAVEDWCRAFGRYSYEADAREVHEESIYDVASITKAVPVALLALHCMDKGTLHIEDRLIDYLPEFTGTYREQITIRHLLTHTLDFGFQLSAYRHLQSDELMEKILAAPLRSTPGTVFSYANVTSILLGLVIERVTGSTLDAAAERILFGPLGMHHTGFFPERFDGREVVSTEFDPGRGRVVHAEVHDESTYALRPKVVGSAGLFSTVPDLLKVVRMLLDGGTSSGNCLFAPETVAMMRTNCSPAPGTLAGSGWELAQPAFMGTRCSGRAFGKTGFTGCSMVIDPDARAGMVLLSNHVHPRRQADRSVINTVRRELADVVFDNSFISHSGD